MRARSSQTQGRSGLEQAIIHWRGFRGSLPPDQNPQSKPPRAGATAPEPRSEQHRLSAADHNSLLGGQTCILTLLESAVLIPPSRYWSGWTRSSLARRSSRPWREVQVLAGMRQGLRNKEIRGCLGISQPGVSFHLSNIYRKTGASRREDAVRSAQAMGVLD